MKNIKKQGKKSVDNVENLVADTAGGEMPDPDQKVGEKASDAAKVFEKNRNKKIRDQMVVDDDGVNDQDTELDAEKKAG